MKKDKKKEKKIMSQMRLPKSLHKEMKKYALSRELSQNQMVVMSLKWFMNSNPMNLEEI